MGLTRRSFQLYVGTWSGIKSGSVSCIPWSGNNHGSSLTYSEKLPQGFYGWQGSRNFSENIPFGNFFRERGEETFIVESLGGFSHFLFPSGTSCLCLGCVCSERCPCLRRGISNSYRPWWLGISGHMGHLGAYPKEHRTWSTSVYRIGMFQFLLVGRFLSQVMEICGVQMFFVLTRASLGFFGVCDFGSHFCVLS